MTGFDSWNSVSRRTLLKIGGGATLALGGLATVAKAQASRPLVYAYANWSDGLALSFVGAKLIADNFGYEVEMLQSEVALAYTSIQSGKADVFSSCYLQGTGPLKGEYKGGHADYVNKIAAETEIVGISEGPMTQGLAVPDYVEIRSIEELNANAEKFGGNIIGIDAGSGLMQAADATVKAYGLALNLVAGSEPAMVAGFQRAYTRKDWVVVTTWEPLPMWSKFEMRYLEDPKKTMMEEPFHCFHIAPKSLAENFPKAHAFFKKYHMPSAELAKIMGSIDEGMSPQDAAAKWIDETKGQGIIEPWLA